MLGILLCQNRFMSKKHMEDAMAHELVHAWDTRRFKVKEDDWGKDLRAHACTEVHFLTCFPAKLHSQATCRFEQKT
jgi:hypothetical protein